MTSSKCCDCDSVLHLRDTSSLVSFAAVTRVATQCSSPTNGCSLRALSIRPKIPEIPGEWNRHFPKFNSEILGVPREVGLKFRKIGITGKFCSIRPFLLGPRFSETGNRNSTWLILKLLNVILVLYQTND